MKLADLESQIIGEIHLEEPLKHHTGIRLGGAAKFLVIPKGIEDLRRALVWAGRSKIPFRVMGNGSSVLSHPDGYHGMVLKLAHVLNHIRIDENRVYVGTGAMMSVLVRQMLNPGLSGLEEWYGPHTVGGWLSRMGRRDATVLDHLVKEMYVAEPDGTITRLIEPSQLYEMATSSELAKTVVEVVFQLQPGDPAVMAEIIHKKEREWSFLTQLNLPLVGPLFLNPEEELGVILCEYSGLKNGQAAFLGIGGGFIVNLGNATYDDVVTLLTLVQEKVQSSTVVTLLAGTDQIK